MSVDKLVDSTQLDSDLTDVADEIRTAGGTLLPLSFPDDYVVAIGDIGNTEIKTASGSIAHFEDALARKAQDLTVAIEPVQSGSGNPSPDNVRPISGWTGANVTRTGKNLLRPGLSPSDTGCSTITPTASGGYVLRATAATGWLWNRISVLPAKPFAGKRLIFGFDISIDHDQNPQTIFALRNSDGVVTSKIVNYSASRLSAYLDIPADVTDDHFITMTLYVTTSVSASVGWETTYSNLQIEIIGASETAPTAYEPYNGDTYSITFPTEAGTVYGGTLDVTTGKLTVTKFALDLGTLSFEQSASYAGRFFARFPTDNPPVWYAGSQETVPPRLICSSYTAKLYTSIWANGETGVSQFVKNNGAAVGICDTRFSDAQSFAEYVNGKMLVYELATPIVYDLDPVTVTTLLGTNNVWADTGDSTIKYIAPKAQIPSAQGVYF